MASSHGSSATNSNNQTAYQYEYNVGNIGLTPQALTTALTGVEQANLDIAGIYGQEASNQQQQQNAQFTNLLAALQGQNVQQVGGISPTDLIVAGAAVLVVVVIMMIWK